MFGLAIEFLLLQLMNMLVDGFRVSPTPRTQTQIRQNTPKRECRQLLIARLGINKYGCEVITNSLKKMTFHGYIPNHPMLATLLPKSLYLVKLSESVSPNIRLGKRPSYVMSSPRSAQPQVRKPLNRYSSNPTSILTGGTNRWELNALSPSSTDLVVSQIVSGLLYAPSTTQALLSYLPIAYREVPNFIQAVADQTHIIR